MCERERESKNRLIFSDRREEEEEEEEKETTKIDWAKKRKGRRGWDLLSESALVVNC